MNSFVDKEWYVQSKRISGILSSKSFVNIQLKLFNEKKKRNNFVDKERCVQVRGFQSRGKTKRDIN